MLRVKGFWIFLDGKVWSTCWSSCLPTCLFWSLPMIWALFLWNPETPPTRQFQHSHPPTQLCNHFLCVLAFIARIKALWGLKLWLIRIQFFCVFWHWVWTRVKFLITWVPHLKRCNTKCYMSILRECQWLKMKYILGLMYFSISFIFYFFFQMGNPSY